MCSSHHPYPENLLLLQITLQIERDAICSEDLALTDDPREQSESSLQTQQRLAQPWKRPCAFSDGYLRTTNASKPKLYGFVRVSTLHRN